MNSGFRFHRSDSGESPTGSTLSLIFNGLNVTFGGPIDGGVKGVFGGIDFSLVNGDFGSQIELFEFSSGQISEFVHGIGSSVVGRV